MAEIDSAYDFVLELEGLLKDGHYTAASALVEQRDEAIVAECEEAFIDFDQAREHLLTAIDHFKRDLGEIASVLRDMPNRKDEMS